MSSALFFFASVVVHIRFCRNGAFLRRSNFVEEHPPTTRFFGCALVVGNSRAQEQRVAVVTADVGVDIIVLKLEVVVVSK